jgi:SnoaL-like domain
VTQPGRKYVEALAAKDTEALTRLFADDVDFRGMTPGRFWEARSPADVVHEVLYEWFEPSDEIVSIENLELGAVVDRSRVDYTLRVSNPDGLFAVEQRAYYDLDDFGRIKRMHVMCAGFRILTKT